MFTLFRHKRVILIVSLVLFLILIVGYAILSRSQTASQTPIPHKAIRFEFTRNSEGKLTAKIILLQAIYLSKLSQNMRANFYKINLISLDEKILFSGQVPIRVIRMVDTFGKINPYPPVEESRKDFLVFLPYYRDAKKIMVYDERNILQLTVDLSSYIHL